MGLWITLWVLVSFSVGGILGRLVASREWRKHCEANDVRWFSYQRRLIEEDVARVEKKHYDPESSP